MASLAHSVLYPLSNDRLAAELNRIADSLIVDVLQETMLSHLSICESRVPFGSSRLQPKSKGERKEGADQSDSSHAVAGAKIHDQQFKSRCVVVKGNKKSGRARGLSRTRMLDEDGGSESQQDC